jgi:hypothetical protein
MQKSDSSILTVFILAVFSLAVISCKEDEPEQYNLTFSQLTQTATESDLEIKIDIKLDKPAPEDVTINFELSGTALDDVRAETEEDYADYAVDGEYDEIVIKQGESAASIMLVPFSDDFVEDDETIIVTLTKVSNTNVILDQTIKSTTTIKQEDGLFVLLEWPESNTANGFVDMDLIIRIGETSASYNGILTGSAFRSFDQEFEYSFIPKAFIGTYFDLTYTNTTYGLSYTYYDGTRSNLTFTVTFIDLVNGSFEPVSSRRVDTGNYTLANLNKWSTTVPTLIAQTFRNVGGTYQDFTAIATPTTSSRSAAVTANEFINSLYRKPGNSFRQPMLPEKYLSQF